MVAWAQPAERCPISSTSAQSHTGDITIKWSLVVTCLTIQVVTGGHVSHTAGSHVSRVPASTHTLQPTNLVTKHYASTQAWLVPPWWSDRTALTLLFF